MLTSAAVNQPTAAGAKIPGTVAKVFDIPIRVPAYTKTMGLTTARILRMRIQGRMLRNLWR